MSAFLHLIIAKIAKEDSWQCKSVRIFIAVFFNA